MSERKSFNRRDFLKSLGVGAAIALFPVACSNTEDADMTEGAAMPGMSDDPLAAMKAHTRTDPGAWGGKEDGHIPQATLTKLDEAGNYRVDVFVQHEMKPEHWIQHVWLRDDSNTALGEKVLQPTDPSPASASFTANVANIAAFKVYELCSLHGLWVAEYGTDSLMSTEQPTSERYDLTIIGGGPTALFGAFYAGLRQLSVKVVDSLPELGGQLSALYPEKLIYDMPGFPEIIARDLVRHLTAQAMTANPTVHLEERVLTLDLVTPDWIALTTDRGVHITRTVLIAAGIGGFSPRSHRATGVDEFTGRGLQHFIRDPAELKGKRVLIVGGGDSACDWALSLVGVAESVILIHRRDVFRAHEETVHQVLEAPVDVRTFWELAEVRGDGHVEQAVVTNVKDKTEATLEVDAVLLAIGFTASLGPILDWNLNLEGNKIRVDSTMATNLPGVFAAGDVVTYPGKLDLIATGVGEAATAANHAKNYLDPSAKIAPGHSSDLDTSVTNVKVP